MRTSLRAWVSWHCGSSWLPWLGWLLFGWGIISVVTGWLGIIPGHFPPPVSPPVFVRSHLAGFRTWGPTTAPEGTMCTQGAAAADGQGQDDCAGAPVPTCDGPPVKAPPVAFPVGMAPPAAGAPPVKAPPATRGPPGNPADSPTSRRHVLLGRSVCDALGDVAQGARSGPTNTSTERLPPWQRDPPGLRPAGAQMHSSFVRCGRGCALTYFFQLH